MTSMAFPTAAAGPFYSADYDRYRFIELLLEKERKLAGLTQEELATKCGSPYVKAFHITTMENLTKTISDKSRRVDRARLLMVVSWGLRLPKWKVDLFLELFDGTPLSEPEFDRYLFLYEHEEKPATVAAVQDGGERLRSNWFTATHELLADWLWPHRGPVSVNVSVHSDQTNNDLERERAVLELESRPGMHLAIRSVPLRFTVPPPRDKEEYAFQLEKADPLSPQPGADIEERFAIELKRHETFHQTLRTYGYISIHSMPTIKHLLQQQDEYKRLLAREQLRRLTSLLWEYDDFHIGLADNTPFLELKIVGFDWAIMAGAIDSLFERANWGPRFVQWNDPTIVLTFVSDFWENFYRLPPNAREKAAVIDSLCEIAELPHPRSAGGVLLEK